MQIAPDKYNAEDADSDFDFLKSDEPSPDQSSSSQEKSVRRSSARRSRPAKEQSEDRPFPKIRKPVPVTESGAIRAPKAGDPVAPPPPLTDGIKPSSKVTTSIQARRNPVDFEKIDLGLDDDDWPSSDQWAERSVRPMPNLNEEERQSPLRRFGYSLGAVIIIAGVGTALYQVPVVQQWFGSVSPANLASSIANPSPEVIRIDPLFEEPAANSLFQRYQTELEALETMIALQEFDEASTRLQSMDKTLYGYGKPEFDLIAEQIAQGPASPEELAAQAAERGALERAKADQAAIERAEVEQAALEQQAVADQAAAEQAAAEQAAAEQAALEQAALEQAALEQAALEQQAAAERAAAEQAALEQQAAAERAAAEQAALEQQAAAERAAAEQAALEQQAAAERAAAEQAALEQQAAAERAAAEQAALEQQAAAERADAEQLALEQRAAASVEQRRLDRISQQRAREEQLEIARGQRLEQERLLQQSAQQAAAAAAYQPSEWQDEAPAGESQSQTVQDIAAAQRAAAREQRLIEAKERDDSSISEPSIVTITPAENVVARVEIPDLPVVEEAATPRSISDDELQQVYRSFTQLVDSIEQRDIGAMIESTQMSGLRVQQFLQLFENNVSIEAKLRNVSTLDAAGEIQGILQVTRLVRADGSVTGPPFNLSSVQLSSVREGDGWSTIRW